MRGTGWRRLVRQSYRLGARWIRRGAPGGRLGRRAGLMRLLVPLEPWRYWELGRVAEADLAGRVLDVGSPKLLASLLREEGRGGVVATDLDDGEIERWRAVDPALDLRVADARALPFPDASFDACVSVSVVEHIPGDGDRRAMAEIWRILRPGGVLHLTTNVARRPMHLLVDRPPWGAASARVGDRWFFERRYGPGEVARRLLDEPWEVLGGAAARERRPVHDRFFALRPWSFALGGALRWICPRNFVPLAGPEDLEGHTHGAVHLVLGKPAS